MHGTRSVECQPGLKLTAWPACFGFAITGIVTTMLGPMLPALEAKWSLVDAQAGVLFFMQFIGSLIGAILAPHSLLRSLRLGYALISLSLLGLGFATYTEALLMLLLMGLGLGLAMTSTNIIVSEQNPETRASSLTLLNLYWGAGAVLCPAIYFVLRNRWSLRVFLLAIASASAFALISISANMQAKTQQLPERERDNGPAAENIGKLTLLLFGMLLFLYVGAENCVNGWVTTLSNRHAGHSGSTLALAASAFWLAILTFRGLAVPALRHFSERTLRLISLCIALGGTVLLLAAYSPALLVLGAVLTGAGFGPIYPLTASVFLARAGRSRHAGWSFACAGLGGAILPWMTGIVSSTSGSLRIGFLVPVLAIAILLIYNIAARLTLPDVAASAQPDARETSAA